MPACSDRYNGQRTDRDSAQEQQANVHWADREKLEVAARVAIRTPLPALASRLGVSVLDLSRQLRKEKLMTEVQPHELQFIHANLDRMPAQQIRDYLAMTPTQFSQICEKVLRRRTRTAGADLSLTEERANALAC